MPGEISRELLPSSTSAPVGDVLRREATREDRYRVAAATRFTISATAFHFF